MKWAPVITGTDGEGRPGEAREFAKRRERGEQGVPEVDGGFLQQPLAAFQKGEILKLPLMSGSNSEDGVLFGWAISPVCILLPSTLLFLLLFRISNLMNRLRSPHSNTLESLQEFSMTSGSLKFYNITLTYVASEGVMKEAKE